MNDNPLIKDYLSKIGKKGGDKTKQQGKSYYSQLGKKGMAKRWKQKKRKRATDEEVPQSLLSKH